MKEIISISSIVCGVAIAASFTAHANLADLSNLSNEKSRCISPENFTGEPGKAAMAVPFRSKARNVNNASHAAQELGQGWKVNPFVNVSSNETFTLADTDGPGTIRHIWLTLAKEHWQCMTLRIYWDGETTPSVEAPAGNFFCQGWGEFAQVSSPVVCVNPGSAFNCYWPMPFRKHCRITMQNTSNKNVRLYYYIDYSLGRVAENAAYFHAQYRHTVSNETSVFTIVDGINGRGHYVGTYLAWRVHNTGWWGEGEVKFYIDDDRQFPTICSTGLEDYFCGSYNFDLGGKYRTFSTPYAGLCQVLPENETYKEGQKFGLYRWHLTDPVRFEKSLKVTVQDLGWKKDWIYLPQHSEISATSFWYQEHK